MNKQLLHLLLAAGVILLFFGCSKKNSNEACIHQASIDLDAGNYDAVLASSCSDSMQRGAAYFGKAGFDATTVINRFVQTGSNSGGTGGKNNITFYMTDLIGVVTEGTLTNLNGSVTQFKSVPLTADEFKDAQFNLSLVSAINGLCLIKLVSADINIGTLDTTCDINNDTLSDGSEAEACALVASDNINTASTTTCKNDIAYAPLAPVDITFVGKSGTYAGLTISLTGTATASCPAKFAKLLYKDGNAKYWAALTSASQRCTGSDGNSWPCPLEQNGKPMGLADSLFSSLQNASTGLQTSITTTSANVNKSINDITAKSCPQAQSSLATTCSTTDIANYLQTITK